MLCLSEEMMQYLENPLHVKPKSKYDKTTTKHNDTFCCVSFCSPCVFIATEVEAFRKIVFYNPLCSTYTHSTYKCLSLFSPRNWKFIVCTMPKKALSMGTNALVIVWYTTSLEEMPMVWMMTRFHHQKFLPSYYLCTTSIGSSYCCLLMVITIPGKCTCM